MKYGIVNRDGNIVKFFDFARTSVNYKFTLGDIKCQKIVVKPSA
jgi:hypothetical protein